MLYSIYAEITPNPEVMKFVANRVLINGSAEISTIKEAKGISIAQQLLKFPFVKSIYMSSNFISITKSKEINWEEIAMQLRIFISDFLNNKGIDIQKENLKISEKKKNTAHKNPNYKFSKKEKEIEAILEEYIKPAVQSDGGEITLESLKGNIVTVNLKGSCSGCPSATSTLKGGIENLLQQKIDKNIHVIANEK